MNFIFDNNLSRSLAHGVNALSASESRRVTVIHLKDRFDPDTPDVDWLTELAEEGNWMVVSCDKFKKTTAERELVRSSGVSLYVLDPQWLKHRYWDQAHQLVLWWPRMLQHAALSSRFAVRVPWRFTNQTTFEQIRV